jgi:ABC-type amino acid transport substrate-binding protein
MRRLLLLLATVIAIAGSITVSRAQTTLEKINQTGVLTIGTRTGSPPFAYVTRTTSG